MATSCARRCWTLLPSCAPVTSALLAAAVLCMPLMLLLRSYTDTATFALRCGQCRTPLKGEKDATKHAKETGHTQFVEYDA